MLNNKIFSVIGIKWKNRCMSRIIGTRKLIVWFNLFLFLLGFFGGGV